MVSAGGIEPLASHLSLLWQRIYSPPTGTALFGTPGRDRTCDPLLRRQLLYPLSYGCTNSTAGTLEVALYFSGERAVRYSGAIASRFRDLGVITNLQGSSPFTLSNIPFLLYCLLLDLESLVDYTISTNYANLENVMVLFCL